MDGPRCAVDPNSPPASTVAAADGDACALPCEKVYYAGSILSNPCPELSPQPAMT